jgi:hypothetical protein
MFYHISKKSVGAKSSLITIIVIFGTNSLMLGYQALLDWYIAAHPGYNPTVNFFWYMGFASFYLGGMTVLYRVHYKENVRIGSLGQYASFSFFAAGSLQLFQYIEIVLFKTNTNMFQIYTYGIPAINIATVLVCFGFALMALYYLHFSKKGLVGLKRWTI